MLSRLTGPTASTASRRWRRPRVLRRGQHEPGRPCSTCPLPCSTRSLADSHHRPSFTTDQGRARCRDAFQASSRTPHGVTVVTSRPRAPARNEVSTTVSVLIGAGRGVEAPRPTRWRAQCIGLVLRAPQLGTTWYFPDGFFVDGVAERFHVYNPGRRRQPADHRRPRVRARRSVRDHRAPRRLLHVDGDRRVAHPQGRTATPSPASQSTTACPVVARSARSTPPRQPPGSAYNRPCLGAQSAGNQLGCSPRLDHDAKSPTSGSSCSPPAAPPPPADRPLSFHRNGQRPTWPSTAPERDRSARPAPCSHRDHVKAPRPPHAWSRPTLT